MVFSVELSDMLSIQPPAQLLPVSHELELCNPVFVFLSIDHLGPDLSSDSSVSVVSVDTTNVTLCEL